MISNITAKSLLELSGFEHIETDTSGRIVDFIESTKTRPDTPEERIRQYYTRVLVEEYNYPKNRIALEVKIMIGSEARAADIVVYNSPQAKQARDQGRIHLIVETKAPDKKSGHGQLRSYVLASSSSGGVWTNGGEVAYYRKVSQPQTAGSVPTIQEWTNIPRYSESWDVVGHYRKDQLKPPRHLKQVFQRCHNSIYKAGLDSEDIAIDMVRLILAKYMDEQNIGDVCEFRCTPEEFKTPSGRNDVAKRVRNLFAQVVEAFPDVFPEHERISAGKDNIATVVNELQPFQFLADHETEQVYDVIGTAFEVYVAAHLKGGRGQYFTNRLVVNMMVEVLDPDERDIIFDPSCGSGGFLISCLRYVRNKIIGSKRSNSAKGRAIRNVSDRLFGVDISPKLARVAKTNMILNGDGHGGLVQGNMLRKLAELPSTFILNPSSRITQRPTKIFSNPPFGASLELRERSPAVLGNFELGHIHELNDTGQLVLTDALNEKVGVPPEVLFLERCIDLLAPNGKLAIVIARGVLDNRDALIARHYILQHTKVLAVINCHPNTFAPFNGTKAAVLVLQKKKQKGVLANEDYPIFMAISQSVGQDSQGREIHKRTPSGTLVFENGLPVIDHDLHEITLSFRQFLAGQTPSYESAWITQLSEITKAPEMRFNPTRYAPAAEAALAKVLELADSDDWKIERLGDIAAIFNGPRFKRPFADKGATGEHIVKMFTPKAFFEERGESAKYLDLKKASSTQLRQIETLTLKRNYIMIVDSGTAGKLLGRVGLTTAEHENTVGNNNMIRVIIDDPQKRDFVYQFLRSDLGQQLLVRNVYGTNQDHIEPEDVKNIPVPIPRNPASLQSISDKVQRVNRLREEAAELDRAAMHNLDAVIKASLKGG